LEVWWSLIWFSSCRAPDARGSAAARGGHTHTIGAMRVVVLAAEESGIPRRDGVADRLVLVDDRKQTRGAQSSMP
jgi:hypothetical protein